MCETVVRDFAATANGSGEIVLQYATIRDTAKSSGVETFSGATSTSAPTVAAAERNWVLVHRL